WRSSGRHFSFVGVLTPGTLNPALRLRNLADAVRGHMQDILDDFGHATWLPFSVIAARLALATFLGAIIGFEREWRNQPAGLRTHILVALAAACFTIIGIEIVHTTQFNDEGARQD